MQSVIVELPGQIGTRKARALAQRIAQFYFDASPELRAEIERRAERLRQQSESAEVEAAS